MMNLPSTPIYRLAPRGGGGLACDRGGVTLGPAELVRAVTDATGRRRYEVRPPGGLGRVLSAAYRPQPEEVVFRLHRGLLRAASAIEAGDLCLACIETVLLRLPDPTHLALAKLAEFAELEKGGTGWENEPRVPAGQPDGGQWTTEEGSSGAPALDVKSPTRVSPSATVSPPASASRPKSLLPLGDGVFRPDVDAPRLILAGGAEEEETAPRRSNGPPPDFTILEDVFPQLKEAPGLGVAVAPVANFLGVTGAADEANLEATMGQYWSLLHQIKQIDPSFVDNELLPPDGIAGLTWQGRNNLIDGLRMARAGAFYQRRGDIRPLQVETLRFLQKTVDKAYDQAVALADAGRLNPKLSRNRAIGIEMDGLVRARLSEMLSSYQIPHGPGDDILVNNRDYETNGRDYRVPDARVGDISYDWTLWWKTIGSSQIRGFFRAASQPRGVVIIRPSQLGTGGAYLIPRPVDSRLRR
jgi:hypothetical protein